jgi:hypothetical protein
MISYNKATQLYTLEMHGRLIGQYCTIDEARLEMNIQQEKDLLQEVDI